MGANCSQCCTGFEKKLKQFAGQEEGELHIIPQRQMNHHNLSMVVEDSYESQLSYQNSYVGMAAQSATNSTTNGNPLTDFWIIDIQERFIMASATNDSSLIYRISVQFNDTTQEYCILVEETAAGIGSVIGSLNNSILLKNPSSSTPTTITKAKNAKTSNILSNPKDNQSNLTSPKQINNSTSKFTSAGLQSRNLIYPLEKQINDLYSKQFGIQLERIPDFGADEGGMSGVIEVWETVLEKISGLLGIGYASNVVILNNFMRFSRLDNNLFALQEKLLHFVFEKLLWERFTLCSTGPAILKYANRKTGVVFDITSAGFVYCLPVGDGRSLDSSFRLLRYSSKTTKQPFLNEATPKKQTSPLTDNSFTINPNGDLEINKINEKADNSSAQQLLKEKEQTVQCLSPKDQVVSIEFSSNNKLTNNNKEQESVGSQKSKSNIINNKNNPQSPEDDLKQTPSAEQSNTFSSQVAQFLASLDHDFLKNCFQSRSIIINNQSKLEAVQTIIMQQLNIYFASILPPADDYFIPTPFQPVFPKSPHLSRLLGATDLIKLNVLETISNSKYARMGVADLLKDNPFL